jgi:hypothetical protein
MLFRSSLKIALAAVVFSACNDKLELNAPYREIPSVYAVLNPLDAKQVIRINKIFLGEGDANVMAKVSDSVNYGPGELQVYLTCSRYGKPVNASVQNDTVFFTEEMGSLDAGPFAQPQRLYVTEEKLHTSGDYTLTVRSLRSGNVFRAKASSMDGISPSYPPFYPPLRIPYPADSIQLYTTLGYYADHSSRNTAINVPAMCNTPCGCPLVPCGERLYQLYLRVHYNEATLSGTRSDYFEYHFNTLPESAKVNIAGQHFIKYQFTPAEFFNAMSLAVSKKNLSDNVIDRRLHLVEYFVYTTTQEYIDFLQYNSPSFGINQQAPVYSNFENKAAIGIFTFRTSRSVRREPSKTLMDDFARNSNTCGHRFVTSTGEIPVCR